MDGSVITVGTATIELADAKARYDHWPAPMVIVSDGPYGLASFPGDPPTAEQLPEWYAPHIAAWAERALPSTTLWFWGTEIGWATVHATLMLHGWEYRSAHIWDKGKGHIAGNVNGNTIRRYPVVTEVCVQYTRRVELPTVDRHGAPIRLPMKAWVRHEWQRSGLPLSMTNAAAGVKNAATRKWFTADHLWYYPPPTFMEVLARFANERGKPSTHPYFSLDGKTPLTAQDWAGLRATWNYTHGITNVWTEPPVRGGERLKEGTRFLHINQKPLRLIERCITASSNEGDVVWEPFGGLCTAAVGSLRTGRRAYAAEILPAYFQLAKQRLEAQGSGRTELARTG